MTRTVRTRLTAAERTEQLISAAVKAFSASGYAGTTTDEVARLAGVSQPYVIRLFGSKQALFIAATEYACGRIEQAFRQALQEDPDLASVGAAYDKLLVERELIAMLLHGFAASSDPVIGPVVRRRFGAIYRTIRDLSGAPIKDVRDGLAMGMLLTVLAAMQIIGRDAVPPEDWMSELIETFDEYDHCPPGSS